MKKRIDVLLVEKGLSRSREKAKAQVIAGNVLANGKPVRTPSEMFDMDQADIVIKQDSCPFVSRGGLKLEKAIQEFRIDLAGRVCADIGASTGGFTDCMLRQGAEYVYAVDVGYGQFDWKLRNDERVGLLERTNARYLEAFSKRVEFASIDVSFISLALIFPAVARICRSDVDAVALIKPQFEAGKEKVGKKGVVKDAATHMEVIRSVQSYAQDNDMRMTGLTFSPVKGPNGNIEYLCRLESGAGFEVGDSIIQDTVKIAHKKLD